mmetsp:Transcript_8468/g.13689  ORF Transcript_8468/g.13689 Transcript_8468/m.13689 type:complete len:226 (+) Transcript_8468:101-778(+)
MHGCCLLAVSGGMIGEGFFNPHSLELFSGWERWDWIDLGVFAGMVVFVAGVSVQLLESCGWDCLAYFVLVVSGIDEVVWLWRSKKGSSSGSSSRRGGLPRSLLQLRRHTRSRKSNKKIMGGGRGSNDDRRGIADEQSQGWGYGEGLGLHMWLWLAGAVVLCTWRASVALHLLFLFAFCVYHWTMKVNHHIMIIPIQVFHYQNQFIIIMCISGKTPAPKLLEDPFI